MFLNLNSNDHVPTPHWPYWMMTSKKWWPFYLLQINLEAVFQLHQSNLAPKKETPEYYFIPKWNFYTKNYPNARVSRTRCRWHSLTIKWIFFHKFQLPINQVQSITTGPKNCRPSGRSVTSSIGCSTWPRSTTSPVNWSWRATLVPPQVSSSLPTQSGQAIGWNCF